MAATAPLSDIVIRASAGTGKTYQLTNRFVRLLASGVAPEAILAATFTRKAAGEILERILLTLAHAASDVNKCLKLAAAIDRPQLNRLQCRDLLVRVTSRLHRLQIGTIDSFFARLASSFSLELGLPPGWRIIDDIELKRLRQELATSRSAQTDRGWWSVVSTAGCSCGTWPPERSWASAWPPMGRNPSSAWPSARTATSLLSEAVAGWSGCGISAHGPFGVPSR